MIVGSRRVEKPWGYELWWAATELYAGKILHVEAGHRLSLQYHKVKDESCYLLAGSIRLVTGPSVDDLETLELGPSACWRNHPGQIHTIEAVETSDVLEVSTPQLEDVVRLLDDYGRTTEQSGDGQERRAAPLRVLDRDQIAAKLGLSRAAVRELTARSDFPPPVAYFRGRTLWDEATIDAQFVNPPVAQSLTVPA